MALKFSSFDIDALAAACGEVTGEKLVDMAKCAENAERYEDMCCFMQKRVKDFPDQPLNTEERNFLSVAYKNVVGARRSAWRNVQADMEVSDGPAALSTFKKQIETELETISLAVLDLLNKHLIPTAPEDTEEKVFYLKMAGDYYRYLTESVMKEEYKTSTGKLYADAFDVAKRKLIATHPIRLGLALNYSVCKYEIFQDPDDARTMAKDAFDDAIKDLDKLPEADYKDSTLIMQLLRDNLTLWNSHEQQEQEPVIEDLDA